eukprot:maker-scaffold_63-snap-gene-0.9-mRNA-1 protein AED:0.29 eAED:0.29 QI:87/1/1/1/1/1/2/794/192
MKRVCFVTGNKNKLNEVRKLFSENQLKYELESKSIDLPEFQGEPEFVVRQKCLEAVKALENEENKPDYLMVEDTSLGYTALKGLPGVYVKWFFDKLGHDGMNTLLHGYEDKSAVAETLIGLYNEETGVQVFSGKTKGRIVPPRGESFGWDPIFEVTGTEKTYAEMSKEEKNKISHRARAMEELIKHLKEQNE